MNKIFFCNFLCCSVPSLSLSLPLSLTRRLELVRCSPNPWHSSSPGISRRSRWGFVCATNRRCVRLNHLCTACHWARVLRESMIDESAFTLLWILLGITCRASYGLASVWNSFALCFPFFFSPLRHIGRRWKAGVWTSTPSGGNLPVPKEVSAWGSLWVWSIGSGRCLPWQLSVGENFHFIRQWSLAAEWHVKQQGTLLPTKNTHLSTPVRKHTLTTKTHIVFYWSLWSGMGNWIGWKCFSFYLALIYFIIMWRERER